jgi:hypothetical protein
MAERRSHVVKERTPPIILVVKSLNSARKWCRYTWKLWDLSDSLIQLGTGPPSRNSFCSTLIVASTWAKRTRVTGSCAAIAQKYARSRRVTKGRTDFSAPYSRDYCRFTSFMLLIQIEAFILQ